MPLQPPAPAEAVTVSVLVVNYNGSSFLPGLLASLQTAFVRYRAEVIVLDNASSDGSAAYLLGCTGIKALLQSVNTGFAGGNNIAAQYARGTVLLLLNNDTFVNEPLDELVDAALGHDVGAAGCALRYGDGRLQFSIGLAHTPMRLVLSWLGLEKRRWSPAVFRKFETRPECYALPQRNVNWISGACLATRREVWDRLGGLDERFFMYCEDVDYAMRARVLGLRVAYLPRPCVTHFEGGGKPWVGAAALHRSLRSYVLLVSEHQGWGQARAVAGALSVLFGLRCAVFRLRAVWRRGRPRLLDEEKAQAYGHAAAVAARAALKGQVPAPWKAPETGSRPGC